MVSTNYRVPGVYTSISNQDANTGLVSQAKKILVIGQKLATGTAVANVPFLATSSAQCKAETGNGSALAVIMDTVFKNENLIEKWVIPQDDAGGGVKASATLTMGGTATENGVFSLQYNDTVISVPVLSGDTSAEVTTAFVAEAAKYVDLPILFIESVGNIEINARNAGTLGNTIRVAGGGAYNTSALPASLTVDASSTKFTKALTSGATDPDIADAIANIPDDIFDYIIVQYNDSTNVTKMITELDRRWGETVQIDGVMFIGASGDVATVKAVGDAYNSQYLEVHDAQEDNIVADWHYSSAYGAQVAGSASEDPARPFNTLPLVGITAPSIDKRRKSSDLQILLTSGVATSTVTRDNRVIINRATTSYTETSLGAPDPSYLDINTTLLTSTLRQSFNAWALTKYARMKIVDDIAPNLNLKNVTSPALIAGDVVGLATQWIAEGWIEDIAGFKQNLSVVRNANDPTRVDIIMKPNLVNGLQIITNELRFIV